MAGDADRTDDALLRELAGVLRPWTEPPAEVLAAARGLFALRDLDAELAALTYDSLLDDEPATVRAAAQPRILTFTAGELTIEVEVDATPAGRRLIGQLVPPQPAGLELRAGEAEPVRADADELGRFVLALPPTRGRVRLRVRRADGAEVETAATVV
ncbi:MAG TPA: hypothetical protein VM367_02590 [Pseudonocardia sp.]|nr:hypothetical protein [Pseudonocardia sp.]